MIVFVRLEIMVIIMVKIYLEKYMKYYLDVMISRYLVIIFFSAKLYISFILKSVHLT